MYTSGFFVYFQIKEIANTKSKTIIIILMNFSAMVAIATILNTLAVDGTTIKIVSLAVITLFWYSIVFSAIVFFVSFRK